MIYFSIKEIDQVSYKLFGTLFSRMSDPEKPINRKIKESLASSQMQAEGALNQSVEVLMKLRQQNSRLTETSNTLSPLTSMSETSNKRMGDILSTLSSGKRLFLVLAAGTILILYLVLKWKHSK